MNDLKTTRKRVLEQNPDIKHFQKKRLTAFFIKLIAIEAVAIALTVSLLNHGVVAAIPVGICLAIILPLWLLKPHKFLVFGVKLGRVVEVKIVQKLIESQHGWIRYNWALGANHGQFAVFKIEDENGRTSKLELEARFHAAIYEGDTLLRLSGVPYPINLKRHTKALCPICGNIMPRESTRCVGCDANAVPTFDNTKE